MPSREDKPDLGRYSLYLRLCPHTDPYAATLTAAVDGFVSRTVSRVIMTIVRKR
jgi:hypothetical protein